VILFLVGNKADLEDQRLIPAESWQRKAREFSAIFYEVSAKTGDQIEDLFLHIAKAFRERYPDKLPAADSAPTAARPAPRKGKKDDKGCSVA
jgi:GTPase SAR1 family protein